MRTPTNTASSFAESPASAPTCRYCGGTHPPGRFVTGCPGPRAQTYLRSDLIQTGQLPQQAEAVAALTARQAEIEADLGGAETLSCVHRDAIRDLLRLELVGDFLFDRLLTQGPLTGRGRTRAALSAYLGVADRLYRLRQMVGLQRRAKPIDPGEAVRRAVAAANQTGADQ